MYIPKSKLNVIYFQNLQAKLGQRVLNRTHGDKDSESQEFHEILCKMTDQANDFVSKI